MDLLYLRPPQSPSGGADAPAAPSTCGCQAFPQAAHERAKPFVAPPLAKEVAAEMSACAQAAQLFFLDLTAGHDQAVVHSHGDHVPLAVRDAATYLWWLPDLLTFDYSTIDASAQLCDSFWEARLEALDVVAEYVSQQMQAFAWPGKNLLEKQYKKLVRHWAEISKETIIREQIWGKRRSFQWEVWWKMCHTNKASESVIRQFVPAGLEAAWELFHFTGMFGTSEAAAESVASILKRYSNAGLHTGRVVESTMMRWNGVKGDGCDDEFLTLCWAKFFGGASADVYKFEYAGNAAAKRARLWGGSTSLHKRLRKAAENPTWRSRDLKLALRRSTRDDGTPPPRMTRQWEQALRKTREV